MRKQTFYFVPVFALFWLVAVWPVRADDAGHLVHPRANHSGVLLGNGRVLICGGDVSAHGTIITTRTAEIYNPATRRWRATGSMNQARIYPGCVLLPDGRVLAVGGAIEDPLNSAEIYDPATGRWSLTGSTNEPRGGTPILLPTGKVLLAGGSDDEVSCELYDPVTGIWTYTGSLQHKREGCGITLLVDGKVLASGGVGGGSLKPIPQSELYDPATGKWTDTGLQGLPRYNDQQLLLPDGRVLVAGGEKGHSADAVVLSSSEVYTPATGTWNFVGSLATAREFFTANLLGNGKVLAAGGLDASYHPLASIEEFDPTTNQWSTPPFALAGPRYWHTGTTLLDGSVLIAGGYSTGFGIFAVSAEVFAP
jgi:WD40 repeat protein